MSADPASWDPLTDEVADLTGKTVFITGGNTGIGLVTVKLFALRGAKVYLGTRDEGRTQAALTRLKSENTTIRDDQLVRVPLDLTDVGSIVAAADAMARLEPKLHILINLASMNTPEPRTADGWETTMACDYAGHFILTNLLLPLLKTAARDSGADVRIIGLASAAATNFLPASYVPNFTSPDVLANPVPYQPWAYRWISGYLFSKDMIPYCVAKLAVAAFIKELQRRLDDQGVRILCVAIHPGEVYTDQSTGSLAPWLRGLAGAAFLPLEQGSKHPIFAATAPGVRAEGGKYLLPLGKAAQLHPVVDQDEQVQGLWANTEAAVNGLLSKKGLSVLLPW